MQIVMKILPGMIFENSLSCIQYYFLIYIVEWSVYEYDCFPLELQTTQHVLCTQFQYYF